MLDLLVMESKRVILVAHRQGGSTPTSFQITLDSPLNLSGSWTCQVESIYLSYSTLSLNPPAIPTPVLILCDFVEGVTYNDTSIRLLTLISLEPSKEQGYKSIAFHFPRERQMKVVKDYIYNIHISVKDQRLQDIPENLLRGDIVLELLFVNNV